MTNEDNRSVPATSSVVWMLPAIMLLGAVLPLPYGYYIFLRLVVSLAAAFIAYIAFCEGDRVGPWTALFTIIALLFNPVFPVYFSREIWLILDLSTAATFCAFGLIQWKSNKLKDLDEEKTPR